MFKKRYFSKAKCFQKLESFVLLWSVCIPFFFPSSLSQQEFLRIPFFSIHANTIECGAWTSPHSWKYLKPGWTALWATWTSGRNPCPCQGLKIPSNPNLSVVLGFSDHSYQTPHMKKQWDKTNELGNNVPANGETGFFTSIWCFHINSSLHIPFLSSWTTNFISLWFNSPFVKGV